MTIWEILVPRKHNNGTKFKIAYHRKWDKMVRELTGGLTIHPPTVKGEWVAPDGQLFVDSTVPVRIMCTRDMIQQIMDMTARHYEQKAIMAYLVSNEVLIQHYE